MILPDKHISFAESLLGLSTFVLENLIEPKTIDVLWQNFEMVRLKEYWAYHSFDNMVLTVNMLYALGMVEIFSDGTLKLVKKHNYYATN
jgi:hypothetical protein